MCFKIKKSGNFLVDKSPFLGNSRTIVEKLADVQRKFVIFYLKLLVLNSYIYSIAMLVHLLTSQ
jgi:hypothetical protein